MDPGSPSSEPFRALRLGLQLPAAEHQSKVLLVTSAEQGEGKSTLAANYALVSAIGYRNVLLIDADLRRPALHDIFGTGRIPGLVDLAASNGHLKDYTRPIPNFGTLDLLTAGSSIRKTGDLTSSARMAAILDEAAQAYALVVVDSPPLLSAADATGIAALPGVSVLLVVDKGARRRVVRNALRKLELVNANVAGAVMNREGRLSTYGY
ncbi:MAG: CpsD/CapB family tyrosine-protein kinase [Gaiellaceae bacterium]